jgi:Tfp pilus assembly protein PilN
MSGDGIGSALALGLGLLYAQEAPANLLPPRVLDDSRQAGERRDGLRALTGMGLLCLFLILGTIGLEAYLQARASAAGRQVSAASHRLTRIDSARARLQAFQRHAARIDKATSMRTAAAPLLEHLARAVPADLWMEAVTLRRTAPHDAALESGTLPGRVSHGDVPSLRPPDSLRGPRQTSVVLRGWAANAGAPAQLVAALEENPSLTGVQPVLIEQVSLADARRRIAHWPGIAAFDDGPIFFEVHLTAPLSAPTVDVSASELAVLRDMMKRKTRW